MKMLKTLTYDCKATDPFTDKQNVIQIEKQFGEIVFHVTL